MSERSPSTDEMLREVVEACERHGSNSIVALAGVPGTGKSHIGFLAARELVAQPEMVREVQFHPSITYEEFVEGLRINPGGGVEPRAGIFLEWNQRALDDPAQTYVLLIEELTRANVSAVLGELLTYIEHRERAFFTVYSRRPVRVAANLTVIATYNPVDQTAMTLDNALLRRLRILRFPPSPVQLEEMLEGRGLPEQVIRGLQQLFDRVQELHPEAYDELMPFGHGVFSDIDAEHPDLFDLWDERIRHFLKRPGVQEHPFAAAIRDAYPWTDPAFRVTVEARDSQVTDSPQDEAAATTVDSPVSQVAAEPESGAQSSQ